MHTSSDELDDRGFFIVNDFLNESAINALVCQVEQVPLKNEDSRIRRGVVFARRNLLDFDFVRSLATSDPVTALVNSQAPGTFPVRAILFDKTGDANWTVPWHQDRSIAVKRRIDVPGFGPWSTKSGVAHVQPPIDILKSMVTLRMHLDCCDVNNGPLRVIPGTHQAIHSSEKVAALVSKREQTICTTPAGGLLVMRPLLLHASSPAVVSSHRRVIHIEFGPRELPGGLVWAAA